MISESSSSPVVRGPQGSVRGNCLSLCLIFAILPVLLFFVGVGNTGAAPPSEPQWQKIPFACEGQTAKSIADFAIDQDGEPWAFLREPVMAICYYKDGDWHKAGWKDDVKSTTSLAQSLASNNPSSVFGNRTFIEGADKAIYIAFVSERESNSGRIYQMRNGQVRYLTDFYKDSGDSNNPPLYFGSNGRIWNWGNEFIAKFENGEWKRSKFSLASNLNSYSYIPAETQAGDFVFLNGNTIICFPRGNLDEGSRTTLSVPNFAVHSRSSLPVSPVDRYVMAPLGSNHIMIASVNIPGPAVLNLQKMQYEDPFTSTSPLGQYRTNSLIPSKTGGLWGFTSTFPPSSKDTLFQVNDVDLSVKINPLPRGVIYPLFGNLYDRVACPAKDGSFYFFLMRKGLIIFRDGRFSILGPAEGLPVARADWVREDSSGRIWLVSVDGSAAIYSPKGKAFPVSLPWKEYKLASESVVADFAGGIWCCLADDTRRVSRWDGRAWSHFPVDFLTTGVTTMLVDNLNRLHMEVRDSRNAYRLQASGQTESNPDGLLPLLADSVKGGAREFRSSGYASQSPPIVSPDGGIWRLSGGQGFMHFDGSNWHSFGWPERIVTAYKSTDDRVLFLTTANQIITLVDGQLRQIAGIIPQRTTYLIGPEGWQLFDEKTFAASKGRLYPMRMTDNAMLVAPDRRRLKQFVSDYQPTVRPGSPPSPYDDLSRQAYAKGIISASPFEGSHIVPVHDGFFARSFGFGGGLAHYYVSLDLIAPTRNLFWYPAMMGSQVGVCEDPDNNLWFFSLDTLCMLEKRNIEVNASQSVGDGKSRKIKCKASINDKPASELRYSWRVKGGNWSEPEETTVLRVPASGRVEVTAIDDFGNIDTTPAIVRNPT